MSDEPQASTERTAPSAGLVLYDGVCGFCDRFVQWLLARDRAERFQFAPLQGPTAREVMARHPELPAGLDSLVYVTGAGAEEALHWESRGAFLILRDLGYPWAAFAWLRIIPRPITDLGYRLFARVRYKLFGRFDACRIPTPNERMRFLP